MRQARLLIGLIVSSSVLSWQLYARSDQASDGDSLYQFADIRKLATAASSDTTYLLFLPPVCADCLPLWRFATSAIGGHIAIRLVPGMWEEEEVRLALAAECAEIEGLRSAFAEKLNVLESSQRIEEMAGLVGVRNVRDFVACVHEQRFLYELEARVEEMSRYGLAGAPGVVRRFSGEYDQIEGADEVMALFSIDRDIQ